MPKRSERSVGFGRTPEALEVFIPPDLQPGELEVVFKEIVAQIEDLTGHPCASGTHDVNLRGRLDSVLFVDLGRPD